MVVEKVSYAEARAGLRRCRAPAEPPPGVECFRIDGGRCFVATETEGDALRVHAIEGRGVDDVIRAIIESARRQGFRRVLFRTHRKGMGRFMARYGFEADGIEPDGMRGFRREFW